MRMEGTDVIVDMCPYRDIPMKGVQFIVWGVVLSRSVLKAAAHVAQGKKDLGLGAFGVRSLPGGPCLKHPRI